MQVSLIEECISWRSIPLALINGRYWEGVRGGRSENFQPVLRLGMHPF